MFCATLSELNNAPSWNSTPQRASRTRRLASSMAAKSSPKTSIVPAAGGIKPTMGRNSTDLPAPDPPTTPRTSPCRTSTSRFSCRMRPPMRVVSPRTRTIGASDAEAGEKDGEGGIDDDHEKDGADDGQGGEAADALGAARHVEPGVTADERDGSGEERRLDDADPEGPGPDGVVQLANEQRQRHGKSGPGHQRATEQTHEIGEHDQQRQGDDEAEQPRQHQQLDRVERQGAHRVDLLAHLHRADFGGKCA